MRRRFLPILVAVLVVSGSVLLGSDHPVEAAASTPTTIQAVYAVPSDTPPIPGRLSAAATSISTVQAWFAAQMNGSYPVFNEKDGTVGVELLTLSKSAADIRALSTSDLDSLLLTEAEAAFDGVSGSELFVYLEAHHDDSGACGYTGRIVVIVMDNCGTYPSSSASFPYEDTYLVAHELTHLLGAVGSCAPNSIPGGHVDDDNRDVLYIGSQDRAWDSLMLDPGNDDYFNHGRSNCVDIADSPVLGTWASNGSSDPARSAICGGLEATVVGTPGNDTLTGTAGADVIAGLQGDDTIHGLSGDDIICGGMGNDILYGGLGFDVIYGAQGNDIIYAANGAAATNRADELGARLFGGAGDDAIYGTNRWDRMQGGAGADDLFGFEGRDWMRGGADEDTLIGGGNIDDLHGGNGNDRIVIEGDDTVRGGAGARDTCVIPTDRTLTEIRSCELRP